MSGVLSPIRSFKRVDRVEIIWGFRKTFLQIHFPKRQSNERDNVVACFLSQIVQRFQILYWKFKIIRVMGRKWSKTEKNYLQNRFWPVFLDFFSLLKPIVLQQIYRLWIQSTYDIWFFEKFPIDYVPFDIFLPWIGSFEIIFLLSIITKHRKKFLKNLFIAFLPYKYQ